PGASLTERGQGSMDGWALKGSCPPAPVASAGANAPGIVRPRARSRPRTPRAVPPTGEAGRDSNDGAHREPSTATERRRGRATAGSFRPPCACRAASSPERELAPFEVSVAGGWWSQPRSGCSDDDTPGRKPVQRRPGLPTPPTLSDALLRPGSRSVA